MTSREAYARKVLVRQAWRRWRRRTREITEVLALDNMSTHSEVDATLAMDLREALRALPAEQRAVIVLRYYEDLSEAQIAEIVGCPPEHEVTRRVATSRRRRRSALVATGVLAGVTLAIGIPVVMLQHTGRGDLRPADPTVTNTQNTPQGFAERLVSMVDIPAGGRLVKRSPIRWLDHTATGMSLSPAPRHVSRWWTYDMSARSVWAWVSQHKNPGLVWDGVLGSGFPVVPRTRPPTSAVELRPSTLPAGFVLGDVTVTVAALGPHRAAIAVVSTVEPRRSIPEDKQIPTTSVRAVVAWRREPGSPLLRTTLTGAAAARLATGVNVLPKSILAVHSCPPILPLNEVVVTFTATGHTWRAVLGGCFDLPVTLDDAPLGVLTPSAPRGKGAPTDEQLFESELKAQGIRLP